MGSYPITQHGYSMYTMSSMLQKAVRRGSYELAGVAANELYYTYNKMLWNRLFQIAAEDCFGIVTKELVRLYYADKAMRSKTSQYNMSYISAAVGLLCKTGKSRDACYYTCNFDMLWNPDTRIDVSDEYTAFVKSLVDAIPDNVFSMEAITNPKILERQSTESGESSQFSLFEASKASPVEKLTEEYRIAAQMYKSLLRGDLANSGRMLRDISRPHRMLSWKTVLAASVLVGTGESTREIICQKIADDLVNGSRKADKIDDIYICKAIMLICYELHGFSGQLSGTDCIDPYRFIDWTKQEVIDVRVCRMPGNRIPEWVYDVHTAAGRKAGKTGWDTIVTELAALTPKRQDLLSDGSWSRRYEYRHQHSLCSDNEYLKSVEYSMTRKWNPVKPLDEVRCDLNVLCRDPLTIRIRDLFDLM